jgi:hypothetical protein
VWVVEATLKPGERHIYKRRVFYIDEDSWQVVLTDQYDNARPAVARLRGARDQLLRTCRSMWTAAESHTDLQAGRYLVMGLSRREPPHDFTIKRTEADFTPTRCAARRAPARRGPPSRGGMLWTVVCGRVA